MLELSGSSVTSRILNTDSASLIDWNQHLSLSYLLNNNNLLSTIHAAGSIIDWNQHLRQSYLHNY